MTKAAENNAWYREKRPVLDTYLTATKQVEEGAAGNGLLYRPGYLGDMVSKLELAAKFTLSDINYQIVKAAIDRELAQTGHDYDIAFKEAMYAWELEKTTLLTALDRELANNKLARERDIAELDRLEITTNLRKLVIMAAKTAISLDLETLRQEMILVDQSTFPAEEALLAAKLVTAQKKLEVIPYIEIVLAKQQEIIDAENANVARRNALITVKKDLNEKREDLITAREAISDALIDLLEAKESLIAKKQLLITADGLVASQESENVSYLRQYISSLTGLNDVRFDLVEAKQALIPKMNEKSAAMIAHAAELDAWVTVKRVIAEVKEDMAELKEDRVDRRGDIIDSRVLLDVSRLALQEAHIDLDIVKLTSRSDLMTQKISNTVEMLGEKQAAFDEKLTREGALISGGVGLDLYGSTVGLETMREVNDITIDADTDSIRSIALARIYKDRRIADIQSDATMTSELVHLLT